MGRGKGHIPIRTCLSCGRKGNKASMIRMALDAGGKLLLDMGGAAPGRGAYVCRKRQCLDVLVQGGRISRAFKKKGVLQTCPGDLEHFRKEITHFPLC